MRYKIIILILISKFILIGCNKESLPLPEITASTNDIVKVNGPVTIKTNLFVLDRNFLENLNDYKNGVLSFSTIPSVRNARNLASSNLKIGDIIVTEKSEKIPNGLLSKITKISGNEITVAKANITDAFQDLNIEFEIDYNLKKDFKNDSIIGINGSGNFINKHKFIFDIKGSKVQKFVSSFASEQNLVVNGKVNGEINSKGLKDFAMEDRQFTKYVPVNGYYIPIPILIKSNLEIGYEIKGKGKYEAKIIDYSSNSISTNTYANENWNSDNNQLKNFGIKSDKLFDAYGAHNYYANPDFVCFAYEVDLSSNFAPIFCKTENESLDPYAVEFNMAVAHKRNETSQVSNQLLALSKEGNSDFTVSEGQTIEKVQKPPFGSCWFSGLKNQDGSYVVKVERNSNREFSKIFEGYTFDNEGYVTERVDNSNNFKWKFEYDQNKKLSKIYWSFLNGTPISTEYYENGKFKNSKRTDGTIRAERIDNVYNQYTLSGSVVKTYYDNFGSVVGTETLDKNGKLVSFSYSKIAYSDKVNPAAITYKGIDGFDHTGFLYNPEPLKLKENEESSYLGKLDYSYNYDKNGILSEMVIKYPNGNIQKKFYEFKCN